MEKYIADSARKIAEDNSADLERYIARLEKHIDKAEDAVKYSILRFDLLIISLASGALLLSINYTKEVGNNTVHLIGILKASWLFFVICLISNLISQVSGYYSNLYDIKGTRNIIRHKRNKKDKGNQENILRWCNVFNIVTKVLNLISLIAFIVGVICLIIYFNFNI